MDELEVSFRDFELIMLGPQRRERLAVGYDYPQTPLSELLFSNLGLMHLVAPYLPEVIATDFPVAAPMRRLITLMYQSECQSEPVFKIPGGDLVSAVRVKTDPRRAAIAYSSGKDSLWNLWWTQERYGSENVLAVHIRGLNQGQRSEEAAAAVRQSAALGFNLRTIPLLNSSGNVGYKVMRSRDIFLTGLIVPVALEFGAARVITEGRVYGDLTALFTYQAENFHFFNQILKELGAPVRVGWRGREELDAVRDLLLHRPDWLPHVCNCFSTHHRRPSLRRSWARRAPTIPLYETQCGSCFKCRTVNLARVLYDPAFQAARPEDIREFLTSTQRWMRDNRERLADILGENFVRGFHRAAKHYGLDVSAVA